MEEDLLQTEEITNVETDTMIEQVTEKESIIDEMNPTDENITPEESNKEVEKPKKKLTKKAMIIIGSISLAVIAVIVVLIIIIPSHSERVKSKFNDVREECKWTVDQISYTEDSFDLDTLPDDMENMSEMQKAFMDYANPNRVSKVLEAIKKANDGLGFPDYVYQDMLETSSSMGRQTVENDDYLVTWTYHPDHGLEVTYKIKP